MFKVLVVEDDPHMRGLLCEVLRRAGFRTVEAEDGAAGLAVVDQEHVDLVVVDLMMPRMDGYELTRQLRLFFDNLPILMVTAKQDAQDKREGFIAGTDDYMTKPVDEEEMVLRIKALLRRSQIASEHRLTLGEVTLDYNELSATQGDQTITLPMKEFQLLFKLASNPGMIYTRMQLMDELWDADADDHTLNVHINRLRERFGPDWGFEIVTVRGLGYKVVKRP